MLTDQRGAPLAVVITGANCHDMKAATATLDSLPVRRPRSTADLAHGAGCALERRPLEGLAADNQLMAFQHAGFWQPMDTLREKQFLESLWESGRAPWKLWKDREHESRRILSHEESLGHGPHRLQGGVARHVA